MMVPFRIATVRMGIRAKKPLTYQAEYVYIFFTESDFV